MSTPEPTPTATQTVAPPSYTLLASESTVQVLSPTVVNDVIYCTLQTAVHGVVASKPLTEGTFESVNSAEQLTFFARSIDEVMDDPRVIAGAGVMTIDANGLLADAVSFTVEYVAPGSTGTTVTAQANVPVTLLPSGTQTVPGKPPVTAALAIIDTVYADLQRLAGG